MTRRADPATYRFAVADFIGMCASTMSACAWMAVKCEDGSPEQDAEIAICLRHQRARARAERILARLDEVAA